MSTAYYDVREDLCFVPYYDGWRITRAHGEPHIAWVRNDAAEVLLGIADRDRCCARRSNGRTTIHRAPVRGYVISEYGEVIAWADILRDHDESRRAP